MFDVGHGPDAPSCFSLSIIGEKILLEIQRKNVRTSSDWVYEIWFEVKGKKDLKSFISSSLTYVSKCSIKERENCKNQIAHKLVTLMLLGLKILSKVKVPQFFDTSLGYIS
ncbi:hypothetical protein KY284_020607 [Solanum tuberosum]|nr:hypothetical protein KY284_020607 [Solanum tuberosum]